MGNVKVGQNNVEVERKGNNFDFLRLAAAIMVLVAHSFSITGRKEQEIIYAISNHEMYLGTLGVIIFFTISGYLIAKSWDRTKDLTKFFWARILRIFPGLLVVVLFSVFIIGPLVTTLSLKDYFFNLDTWKYLATSFVLLMPKNVLPGVFLTNPSNSLVNGSLWTLPLEFKMYIFLALAGIIGIFYKRSVMLCATVLGIIVYLFNYIDSNSTYGLIYWLLSYFGVVSFLTPIAGQTMDVSILFIPFMVGTTAYLYRDRLHFNIIIVSIAILSWAATLFIGGWVLALTTLTLLPYSIIGIAQTKIPFINKAATYGDISYGTYIYGAVIQQTIVHFIGVVSIPIMIALSALFVIPCGFISWHLVENKALKYKSLDIAGHINKTLKTIPIYANTIWHAIYK